MTQSLFSVTDGYPAYAARALGEAYDLGYCGAAGTLVGLASLVARFPILRTELETVYEQGQLFRAEADR